jgi:hypothetical protein
MTARATDASDRIAEHRGSRICAASVGFGRPFIVALHMFVYKAWCEFANRDQAAKHFV